MDAEVLLAHVLNMSRTRLYTYGLSDLDDELQYQYQTCVKKRLAGMPVAYIIGMREFWSLPLEINNNVLIPRPETELLVELALHEGQLRQDAAEVPAKEKPKLKVLDLGTGSGAIALAIASEKPHWDITAVDICPHALTVARHNAQKLQLHNITFVESHWFDALSANQTFNIIVSNPPYIAADDIHLNAGDVRFEPVKALIAAQGGLDCLFHIIRYSLARLAPNGLLLIEHGYNQDQPVKAFFESCGFQNVVQHLDLQKHIRVTGGASCQM